MEVKNIYFIGIGGIGMSALARYFLHEGRAVAGYDRTPSELTQQLEREGAAVHYDDSPELVPAPFRDPASTLVVYTPAVPADHAELGWFRGQGFTVRKRSEMLGHLAEGKYVMAVAGTHGKTTVSTLAAWLDHCAGRAVTCGLGEAAPGTGSAFLGGISRNFGSNLVLGTGNRLAVEADEYDRSFLRLHPDSAVITSTDADHLDIYGDHEGMLDAFRTFASQVSGHLIVKKGALQGLESIRAKVYDYSLDDGGGFHAAGTAPAGGGKYRFDLVYPGGRLEGCTLGVPGLVNVENAVAATALMWTAGFDCDRLREGLATFEGVKRRFEFYVNTPRQVYMDDYAHHPTELTAAITSLRAMFPGRKLTAVFQPHLYSRTADHYQAFARALSLTDEVILAPIYPARELPVEGVCSEMIGRELTVPWKLVEKERIAAALAERTTDVVATFGAGDIDRHCDEIAAVLRRRA
ncbi:MAG: UDP-N-acetylmuramate--L-alanine ligase [Rikenellaceae bacterium]|nr:UDP-N-acetylmuramate--L-alanine ligase [Rikenellaceae bacterium]